MMHCPALWQELNDVLQKICLNVFIFCKDIVNCILLNLLQYYFNFRVTMLHKNAKYLQFILTVTVTYASHSVCVSRVQSIIQCRTHRCHEKTFWKISSCRKMFWNSRRSWTLEICSESLRWQPNDSLWTAVLGTRYEAAQLLLFI